MNNLSSRSLNASQQSASANPISNSSAATAIFEVPVADNGNHHVNHVAPSARKRRPVSVPLQARQLFTAEHDDHLANRQAELFYLQKQIQQQTPMVFVLEDGQHVNGVIEWYDRHSIKVRGKGKVLIYKSAIKYLYKAGETGSASDSPKAL